MCFPEKYGVIPKKCFAESHSSEASRRMNDVLNHKVHCCIFPVYKLTFTEWGFIGQPSTTRTHGTLIWLSYLEYFENGFTVKFNAKWSLPCKWFVPVSVCVSVRPLASVQTANTTRLNFSSLVCSLPISSIIRCRK